MKNILTGAIILTLSFIIMSCYQQTENKTTDVTVKDGVFIHISHGTNDPHRLLMALSMAEKMSADKDVIIYFDITGIDVVLKDSPDITFSHFTGSKAQIQNLLARGIPIMACPGCLKAAGKTSDDLAEGIMPADKDKFFSFTKGRILTLDY